MCVAFRLTTMNWQKYLASWQCCWLLPALGLGLLLTLWSGLDRAVSALFYSPETGFYLSKHPLPSFIHDYAVPYLAVTLLAVLVATLLLGLLPRLAFLARRRKAAFYLLLVLVIGPG